MKINFKIKQKFIYGIIWLLLFLNVFVIDFDYILFSKFIDNHKLIYFSIKYLLIFVSVIVLWKFKGSIVFLKYFSGFVFYPFKLLFSAIKFILYTIPMGLYSKKYYSFVYIYINLILDLILNLKKNIISTIIFIIAFICLYSFDSYFLYVPIFIFTIFQYLHIKKRYNEIFGNITIFHVEFEPDESYSDESLSLEVKKRLDKKEAFDRELIKFVDLIILNLKEIQKRKTYYKTIVFKFIYTFLISVFLFSSINYGLYLSDKSNFEIQINEKIINHFDFFYYSFFSVIPDGSDIIPVSKVAKSIRMLSVLVGIIITIIIISLYFIIVSKKYYISLNMGIRYHELFKIEYAKLYPDVIHSEDGSDSDLLSILKNIFKYK